MIYKLQTGGIIKLQKAGSLPKWIQKLNSWSIPDSDESAGERVLNSTIEQANKASTQEERDQIYKDSAKKNLAVTGQSLMMLPMLGEFTTYGLLGGGLRLGTGMAGSKAGEYVLGKGGDWADKQLNTKFLGTTGRIIGGLGGWWGGSSATTPLFRNLAGKGITLHMPQETFANLRNQYFTNAGNGAISKATPDIVQTNIEAGKLGWAPSSKQTLWHNSDQPLTKLEINFPAWDTTQRGAPLGHSWFTGTETVQGFMGKRPHHLRGTVELKKPMIQIGESIGDGKNATRNQILDFTQKSSADGINLKGIADNTLKNQDVYAVFKDIDVKPKLTAAEQLGIPKGERSNPKALEDPYYWGYQQWNSRYNAAVNSGNLQEAQRLRDLHFKIKAPDTKVVDKLGHPLRTYHGLLDHKSAEKAKLFTKFKGVNWDLEDAVNAGNKTNHWKLSVPNEDRMRSYHTPDYEHALNSYANGHSDKVYDDYLNIKNPFTWNEENLHIILLKSGYKSEKIPFSEPGRFRKIPARDNNGNLLKDENGSIIFEDSDKRIPEKSGFRYPQVSDWADFQGNSKLELMKLGYDGLYIPQYYDSYGAFVSPSQFKSAEPITRTDIGEIIPIVKRDNFHNLDRRYKKGGKI